MDLTPCLSPCYPFILLLHVFLAALDVHAGMRLNANLLAGQIIDGGGGGGIGSPGSLDTRGLSRQSGIFGTGSGVDLAEQQGRSPSTYGMAGGIGAVLAQRLFVGRYQSRFLVADVWPQTRNRRLGFRMSHASSNLIPNWRNRPTVLKIYLCNVWHFMFKGIVHIYSG